jgi:hypothetical protein
MRPRCLHLIAIGQPHMKNVLGPISRDGDDPMWRWRTTVVGILGHHPIANLDVLNLFCLLFDAATVLVSSDDAFIQQTAARDRQSIMSNRPTVLKPSSRHRASMVLFMPVPPNIKMTEIEAIPSDWLTVHEFHSLFGRCQAAKGVCSTHKPIREPWSACKYIGRCAAVECWSSDSSCAFA